MMYSPFFYGYTARSAGSRTTHGVVGARSCAGDGAEKVCHFKGSKTRLLGRTDRGCLRAQGLLSVCFPDVVLDATNERIRDEKCSCEWVLPFSLFCRISASHFLYLLRFSNFPHPLSLNIQTPPRRITPWNGAPRGKILHWRKLSIYLLRFSERCFHVQFLSPRCNNDSPCRAVHVKIL
jgi:hypothetical protein